MMRHCPTHLPFYIDSAGSLGPYDVITPEVYWAPLILARDTPCIHLGQRYNNKRPQEQMGRFTGFARLLTKGEGFPKLSS
jgi:hypothetical protein